MTTKTASARTKTDRSPSEKCDPISRVYAYPQGTFKKESIFARSYTPPKREQPNAIWSFLSKGFTTICTDDLHPVKEN